MDFEELRRSAIAATVEANAAIKKMEALKAFLATEKLAMQSERDKLNRLAEKVKYDEIKLNKAILDHQKRSVVTDGA